MLRDVSGLLVAVQEAPWPVQYGATAIVITTMLTGLTWIVRELRANSRERRADFEAERIRYERELAAKDRRIATLETELGLRKGEA